MQEKTNIIGEKENKKQSFKDSYIKQKIKEKFDWLYNEEEMICNWQLDNYLGINKELSF